MLSKNTATPKIYILICAAFMVAALVAAAVFFSQHRDQGESAENVEPDPRDLPLGTHLSYAYRDDLPGLLQKKYIRVLTTLNRTNFFISEGHLAGYEYSLLKGYEKYLNKKIGQKNLGIVIEFIPVNRDELMSKLIQGYGDIAAAGL
ncbi:MAG: hypothetical protein PHS63_05570, partial [Desulfoplanes sp.]|nr:hypothetical protein [Desulfoplanes sp.]